MGRGPRSFCLVLFLSLALISTACSQRGGQRLAVNGHNLHDAKFVSVNGVRLQYLEWGGTGNGLIFLHGIGDSPHAFDELAPAFTDHFRVVAYARRGHGRSDVRGPYDNDTLVEDLRQLLDSLSIRRAALVGWSLGGNEITEFAARYPERVLGLVYLDCFDTADPRLRRKNENNPFSFVPGDADLASFSKFRDWIKQTWWPDMPWTPAMEAEAADLVDQFPDGSVRFVTSDSIDAALRAGMYAYHARWDQVRVPMLAFFAEPYLEAILPPGATEAERQKIERFLQNYEMPFYESRIPQFRAAAPHARVVELKRTNHAALPFQRRDTILAEMRPFLLSEAKGAR